MVHYTAGEMKLAGDIWRQVWLILLLLKKRARSFLSNREHQIISMLLSHDDYDNQSVITSLYLGGRMSYEFL